MLSLSYSNKKNQQENVTSLTVKVTTASLVNDYNVYICFFLPMEHDIKNVWSVAMVNIFGQCQLR